jgi:hypothetical protein
MADKIFINYRRSLNLTEAQLLQKVLQRHFGKSRVFLDISGLEGGEHWLHKLETQVDLSAAMVCLIPEGWLEAKDEKGGRRLDNPNDFVRFEIARAFARTIPVLPLRLDGASIPDTSELPLNLQQLAFQQAMLLRRESFDDDGDRIARRLKDLIAHAKGRDVPRWIMAAAPAIAFSLGIVAGPTVLTQLGATQPHTAVELQSALTRTQKKVEENETALAQASSQAAAAERRAGAAEAERDRVQAALSETRAKLTAAESAAERAKGEAAASVERERQTGTKAEAEAEKRAGAAEADRDRAKAALSETRAKLTAAETAAEKAKGEAAASVERERQARVKAESEAKRQSDLAADARRELEAAALRRKGDETKAEVKTQQRDEPAFGAPDVTFAFGLWRIRRVSDDYIHIWTETGDKIIELPNSNGWWRLRDRRGTKVIYPNGERGEQSFGVGPNPSILKSKDYINIASAAYRIGSQQVFTLFRIADGKIVIKLYYNNEIILVTNSTDISVKTSKGENLTF